METENRTNPKDQCSPTSIAGRLAKARQFLSVADQIANLIDDQEIADAYITLCVHAGIAASDVICCKKLGTHNQGSSHINAVALLARADRKSSELLRSLLAMKTRSGYSSALSSGPDMVRAGRAALALVTAAVMI